jgi:hypothetical protein
VIASCRIFRAKIEAQMYSTESPPLNDDYPEPMLTLPIWMPNALHLIEYIG